MKILPVFLVALALFAPALAFADVGARVEVLGVGVGDRGIGAGAHVASVGVGAGIHARHCRWRHHRRYCA
jgi:hypothetical protein